MAKLLDAEMAATETKECKLADRRKIHELRVQDATIETVEKAGLLKRRLIGWRRL